MKCNRCGYERTEDFIYCPLCGTDNTQPFTAGSEASVLPVSLNPAADHVLPALNSKLFLTICILFTVSCGLAVFDGSFNVITILLTIFSWLTFSQAKKGFADSSNIRCISGTVYALYIIEYVLAGILAVYGLLVSVVFGFASANADIMNELIPELELEIRVYNPFSESLFSASAVWFLVIFAITALIVFLINFFGLRSIHKFIQSVYQSIDSGHIFFLKCGAAWKWLMAIGIFSALSALISAFSASPLDLYSEGAIAAAFIVASVLVQKHFSEVE